MMLHTYFVSTLLFFVTLASGENRNVSLVEPTPEFVAIEEGKNVSMLCKAISPIMSCSFIVPGELEEIKLIPNETSSNDDINYEYYGDGFDMGECGITIKNIKKENNGKASCIVDLNEHLSRVGADIQITITKELPIDNKSRTILGIVIFSVLTVLFNVVLLCCYIRGQKTARKTKRALSESHTNPAADTMTASEEQMQQQSPSSMQPESNNNDSVKIDMEKQEPLPPVPEDAAMMQPADEMKDMKMEEKMEEPSMVVTMDEKESVENK